jgi:DNA-binding MarR family transcriptional regulator
MFGKKKENSSNIHEVESKIRSAFKTIREEMDDHLASINENTDELQEQHERIDELELKIDKIKEQMDEIQLSLSRISSQNKEYQLTDSEKNVFMVLYSVEQTPLSFSDISMRTGLTELTVKAHIFSMISKGIPILERQIDGQSFFRLDKKFKELQAKENILKIDVDGL